eukprot:CAMPEP_0170311858 /NCGR_PEP_ID=MMETSP0116_2-20130129/56446_1 /TAXON_ID=400756 /ORGANISM="Durinskia baltica, Strain CSIRO CS-38" /LENGTH=59 /DNA_ID=CAMNT_0010564195 /DNA_START=437 /DNA_END=612 /DNA_ORIENTATION=-
MAWGVQRSGRVRYKICSQFDKLGITLKALGNFPEVYRLRIFPISVYTSTTLSGNGGSSS